ncbi:OmpA/MotB family protein [Erythrobacter aurantius]|uniref:OmpA/MotB family protein n=1 Tax=Erythrobacter aurantius TaxID=2909249 RepID=UPI002079E9AD|nr:OmpA family protein [Erythrobacter aurantius]
MSGKANHAQHQDTYFISLNDLLVGLLFIFIVLLMTYSLIFQDSVDKLEDKLTERVEMRTSLLERIRADLCEAGYEAEVIPGEGVLRLPEGVLFAPGQAFLGERARGALDIIADALGEELPCFGSERDAASCAENTAAILEAVYIEGHTDDLAINTPQFRSNWELSSARAIATYNYMINADGALKELPNANGSATLLGASAYADTRRVAKSEQPNAAERAQNRRVDFRFLLSPASEEDVEAAAIEAAN